MESTIQNEIQMALGSIPEVRLFRNNVGQGWAGRVTHRDGQTLTLMYPRVLHAGLVKGSGDLIGWQSIVVTPDMVGKRLAVFLSIEVKDKSGRPSDDQKNWHEQVIMHGGLSCVARSIEEAKTVLIKQ
jgi:hypothetical protein